MLYNKFKYIFPPRPKNATSPSELLFWQEQGMIGQPKMNGSNCLIFMNSDTTIIMNRHNGRLTNFSIDNEEIRSLYRGSGWMVINGEYLNKSKKDEYNNVFNHKFILFDILVYNSDYLIGSTFEYRIELMDFLYEKKECDKNHLDKISENIYIVKSYRDNFVEHYDDMVKTDMYEGLVLKRAKAKLEIGLTENNNCKSQLKIRKATKNYKY